MTFRPALPADLQAANFPLQVYGACYSRVAPTRVALPRLIVYACEVAELLDTTPATCASLEFVQVFSGNKLLYGVDPFAMCYGGHQSSVIGPDCQAEQIGVTRQTLLAIEAAKYSPTLELAFRIAKVFRVPLDAVFQYEE